MKRKGFTLIELLIVVAIIAILAAIAVPNFLEAQVRSKVSRAKADMRSIATALESYYVDSNKYPPHTENGWPYYLTRTISTPQAYMTTQALYDPFKISGHAARLATEYPKRFRYFNTKAAEEGWPGLGPLYAGWSPGALPATTIATMRTKYGEWQLVCAGPDKKENTGILENSLIYDPTNGTTSAGDIVRSALDPDVRKSRN